MRQFSLKTVTGAAIALLGLTACGGSGGAMPGAGSSLPRAASQIKDAAKHYNLSGQYVGKFVDVAYGTGKAKASYTQYQNAVGGILTIKYANSTVSTSVALAVNGSSADGTTLAATGSFYCAFSTTGTYDPATHVMSATYQAVRGCTGDGGTFSLKQQCFYKYKGSEDIRPENGPRGC